jgi:hypothetical protein
VAVVAVSAGLHPRDVWEMDPVDFATMVDVLEERARR